MLLSKKRNTFSAFSKFRFNFEHFQTSITVITDVYLNLRTPKNVVRYMSKKSPFRRPLDK